MIASEIHSRLQDSHRTAKRNLWPKDKRKKPMMCLLIAAFNEELVLMGTISSAVKAGMPPEHIYVVDDSSSDNTYQVALQLLPTENVIRVRRSGKGLALTKGSKKFNLTKRYRWVHIADADGAFAPNYFRVFRREVRVKYAAATGYVRSLPGKRVSEYRVFEYTIGMEIHRRLQAFLNVVPVIPGPTSCFRADIFEKVNFDNKSLTEDFDVTLQMHRQKLGRVQFIPQAMAYTQDPKTVKDFTRQTTRWNRGALQSMVRHKIGKKIGLIDAYLGYQVLQNLLFFVSYLVWVPYLTIERHNVNVLATAFVADVILTYAITLLVAARHRRWDILSAFPHIYVLRWVGLAVFIKAFMEVVVLKKYRQPTVLWERNDSVNRYALET